MYTITTYNLLYRMCTQGIEQKHTRTLLEDLMNGKHTSELFFIKM